MQSSHQEPSTEEANNGPKLKEQLQTTCRRKGYALATERTYWQWVFASSQRSVDPRSDETRRHHLSRSHIQRKVRQAVP